jgi:hypothetical protein
LSGINTSLFGLLVGGKEDKLFRQDSVDRGGTSKFWIGLQYASATKTFQWTASSSTLSWSNWAPGNPATYDLMSFLTEAFFRLNKHCIL